METREKPVQTASPRNFITIMQAKRICDNDIIVISIVLYMQFFSLKKSVFWVTQTAAQNVDAKSVCHVY